MGSFYSKRGTDFVAMGASDSVVFLYKDLILITGSKIDWADSIDK